MTRQLSCSLFRGAALGAALAGLAVPSSSQPQADALAGAQAQCTQMTKGVSFQRSADMAASANAASFLAAAAGSPITCGCSMWSETSRWWVEVCVDERCRKDDPDVCRCYKRERVDFERQDCQVWYQNICNSATAGLSSSPGPASAPSSGPVRLAAQASANSCVCAREVEYDSSIIRCGTRYRYKGWDWTYDHPNGTNSCFSKPVRMRECVEWRGPGC